MTTTDEAMLANIETRIRSLTREIEDLEKQDHPRVAKIEELKLERHTIRKTLQTLTRGMEK